MGIPIDCPPRLPHQDAHDMDGFILSTRAYLEAFLAFEYSNQTLVALGLFLVLVGILKILKSSLVLIVWVALSALGASSIAYGMNRGDIDLPFPGQHGDPWIDRLGITAGASAEALARACLELRGG